MGDFPPVMIKYVGVFDYEKLLTKMYDWLIHNSYIVNETKYKHKIPTPKGAEQEISWIAERNVNVYIKESLKIDIKTWDLREVEIIDEDQLIKKNYAKIRIKIIPSLTTDYSKRLSKMPKLKQFFEKYIYDLDVMEDRLYYRSYKFHNYIKELLDMESKYNSYEWRW